MRNHKLARFMLPVSLVATSPTFFGLGTGNMSKLTQMELGMLILNLLLFEEYFDLVINLYVSKNIENLILLFTYIFYLFFTFVSLSLWWWHELELKWGDMANEIHRADPVCLGLRGCLLLWYSSNTSSRSKISIVICRCFSPFNKKSIFLRQKKILRLDLVKMKC